MADLHLFATETVWTDVDFATEGHEDKGHSRGCWCRAAGKEVVLDGEYEWKPLTESQEGKAESMSCTDPNMNCLGCEAGCKRGCATCHSCWRRTDDPKFTKGVTLRIHVEQLMDLVRDFGK